MKEALEKAVETTAEAAATAKTALEALQFTGLPNFGLMNH